MNKLNSKNRFHIFFSKYKILILIFSSVPIILSICCYFSLPFFNAAGSTAWLGFWGGYLGSAIMAAITLYVLDRQLIENHKENESTQKLQLKIFEYQQEQAWLDKFTIITTNYLQIYSYNDLVDVANVARKDPYKAFYMIKDLFSRAGKEDLEMSIIQRDSSNFREINKAKTGIFILYNDILGDIQTLLTVRIDNEKATLNGSLGSLSGISKDMSDIISIILQKYPNESIEQQFNIAIMTRIKIIEKHEEVLRDTFCNYIHEEQKRIDKILLQNSRADTK